MRELRLPCDGEGLVHGALDPMRVLLESQTEAGKEADPRLVQLNLSLRQEGAGGCGR